MNFLLTFILLTSILLLPMFSGATEIRYEMNDFHIEVTQNVFHETFFIDEDASSVQLPDDHIQLSTDCKLPVVHFKFGSSVLDSAEGDIILAALKQFEVTSNAPLNITGYACELGPDQYNQMLSLQRAETVARLLQTHGFVVETVQGKGSQNPIARDPQEFHRNRRVEIEITR